MSKAIFKTLTNDLPPGVVMRIEGTSGESGENVNGVYLSKEAWLNAFKSERFLDGLKRKCHLVWFGHPEEDEPDPAASCGRLNDAKVLDNGEIWAQFDIIDCPTGRLIANYCKGGTIFGVSERGWGDTPSGEAIGEVDPETFICNGFDIVQFPAYPSAIPDVVAIASASDPRYRRILASAKTEIPKIDDIATLRELRKLPNSKTINEMLDGRIEEVQLDSEEIEGRNAEDRSINDERNVALTSTIARKMAQLRSAQNANQSLRQKLNSSRKLISEQSQKIDDLTAEIDSLSAHRIKLKSELLEEQRKSQQAISSGLFNKKNKEKLEQEVDELTNMNQQLVQQNEKLLKQIQQLMAGTEDLKTRVTASAETSRNLSKKLSNVTAELNNARQNLLSAQKEIVNKDKQLSRITSSAGANTMQTQDSRFKIAYLKLLEDAYGVDTTTIRVNSSATPEQIREAVDSEAVKQRKRSAVTKINSATAPNVIITPQEQKDVDETNPAYYENFKIDDI